MFGFKLSKETQLVITAGFALFAMFFGSGNLVFPLGIGVDTKSAFGFAFFGLFITGILVPFVGLFSVVYCYKEGQDYFKTLDFGRLGQLISFVLVLATLSLMGPFGVGARCILVATAGLKLFIPTAFDLLLNSGICLLIYFLLNLKTDMVEVIGKKLTPVLLYCVVAVITCGILRSGDFPSSDLDKLLAFQNGLTQGYQTMDLLAAFFFSTTTIVYLKDKLGKEKSKLIPLTLKASVMGALLLAFIYFGFIILGAKYAVTLANVAPEQRIVVVAGLCLGEFAMPVVGALIFLACLTTLCVLTNLFATFLQAKIKYFAGKRKQALGVTLICTFVVSLVGFTQLAVWIAKTLELMYPALIVFAVMKIFQNALPLRFNLARLSFWLTTGSCVTLNYLV